MKRRGFTLIELSIVLVIIGLIIGGILVGRELIHQSELRQVISRVYEIETAINTFRTKYNCIPGDCANATDFFSGTENGNGNGLIDGTSFFNQGGGVTYCPQVSWNQTLGTSCDGKTANYKEEATLFWEHMSQSGMVKVPPFHRASVANWATSNGQYWYTALVPYEGMFALSIPGQNVISINGCVYAQSIRHGANGCGGGIIYGMAPIDAYDIDVKVDDGLPLTGTVYHNVYFGDSRGNLGNGCASPPTVNAYAVTLPLSSAIGCGLFFQKAF